VFDKVLSFTVVGLITEWDPSTRRVRIFDLDMFLAPHVPWDGIAVGLVVLVKGHHNESTGVRVVTLLRPWAV